MCDTKVIFVFKQTDAGYSAHTIGADMYSVYCVGKDMDELKANCLEAINMCFDNKDAITEGQIKFV